MGERLLAIGDVHGCRRALEALLDQLAPHPDDTVVFLGDYVDRGPDSCGVLELLLQWQTRCRLVPLLGNHEQMMLSARTDEKMLEGWQWCGGTATLSSYGGSLQYVPDSHWQFLRQCRRWYQSGDYFFVHANYLAELPLEEQPDHMLLWEHLYRTLPPPHCSGKTAVVGHTPLFQGRPLHLGHIVVLDTACYAGQWLTGVDFSSGHYWQANQRGEVRNAVLERTQDYSLLFDPTRFQ